MNNITLIGMPAAGKSTVGVVLAKTMGKSFLDVDLLIQEKEGNLLQNVVNKYGHNGFIQLEEKYILGIDVANTVIAPGGSVVYSERAVGHLKKLGKIVYLRLPYYVIEKRLNNIHSRGIAMRPGESLMDLYKKRIPLYEKYCDFLVDAEGLNVEEVVENIIIAIGK